MSEPKPRIQLSCERGASAAYADAVTAAGGLPCPGYAPEPDLSCAGLVLCGGGDLDPDMFGWPQAGGDPPDRVRDLAEVNLFRAFYLAGRPILGICRGMQVINVFFGGDLVQDWPGHSAADGADRLHAIKTAPSRLRALYGTHCIVNSSHHQVVGQLGDHLEPLQWADDGAVEALRHRTLPVWGVQWHPERLSASDRRLPDGLLLYRAFLSGGLL